MRPAYLLQFSPIADCLLRIFPPECIYQNVSYPDPDQGNGATAEIDTIIFWKPFIILIEAKAKQFRLESQLGDIGRLITDVTLCANISETPTP